MIYRVVAVKFDGDKIVSKFRNKNHAEDKYAVYLWTVCKNNILNTYSHIVLCEGNDIVKGIYFDN